MQLFVEVCQEYKKPAMQVNLSFSSQSNIVQEAEDTIQVQAEFYCLPSGAYVRFGEVEQIVSDSLALLVSRKLGRMMLYTDAAPVLAQMKAAMQIALPGKVTLREMNQQYSIQLENAKKDTSVLLLHLRKAIAGTPLPRESIIMQFNTKTKIPYSVVHIKRNTVEISEFQFNTYKQIGTLENKLQEEGGRYFAVKQQEMSYRFLKIVYAPDVHIPISVNDRVVKRPNGSYAPAPGFETYILSLE